MRKLLVFVFLFTLPNLYSQNINNDVTRVVYKVYHVNFSEKLNSEFNPKSLQFELLFNKNESVFSLFEGMETEESLNNKFLKILYGGSITYYNDNLAKVKFENVRYANGTSYNVKQTIIDKFKWKITNETKTIQGFKCYKATCDYTEINNGNNTSKILHPTVWFTSSIPCVFGPRGLDGLPGLVLEATYDGKTYFLTTDVTFKYKTKKKLTKPLKAIEIDSEKYDSIISADYKKNKGIK